MTEAESTTVPAPQGTALSQPELPAPVHDAGVKIVLPLGLPAFAFAIASVTACYFQIFLTSVLGISAFGLSPHFQAVLMWSLALATVYFLWQDRKRHGSNIPLAIGAVATLILIGTLYIVYDGGVEIIAYILLVIAAALNQNIFLSKFNQWVRQQARQIAKLNLRLEEKVESQGQEINRLSRLKQFLPPQVADLVVSDGEENLLDTHRRYIACIFCDIRDFTSVSEAIEPEEVIAILQSYHERVGDLVTKHRGTIGYRAGDGLMAFFNDPVPCDEPVMDAVRLALDIQAAFDDIRRPWMKLGHTVGLGIGVASGYATLGLVGFKGRADYTAIGSVVNICARLCDRASDGQILIAQRAYMDVESRVRTESIGTLELKGVRNPVEAFSLLGVNEPSR